MEFGADRGHADLLAHVREDLQGFLERGPCLCFVAEFAKRAPGTEQGFPFEMLSAVPPVQPGRRTIADLASTRLSP